MKKGLFLFFLVAACFIAGKILAGEVVDINTATLAQLDTLAGIGPVYAQRIIDGRPYSSIDDLDKVKGIGPTTLQKIRDQGLACVNCDTTTAPASAEATAGKSENSTPPATTTAPMAYPSGIYINEILPNPEGADEAEEWIELYNSNTFDVDLSGWQLQDKAGTIKTYDIPFVTKILANGFLIFKRPETKIMLNNEGDGINLLMPNGQTADSINFVNAPLGQSYNRATDVMLDGNINWLWSITSTSAATNIITSQAKNIKSANSNISGLSNTKKSDNNNLGTASLANSLNLAENQTSNGQNPWFLFFSVLGTTIILATLVLLIKFKFKGPGEAKN